MNDNSLRASELERLTPDEAAAHWLVIRDRGFQAREAGSFSAWLSASDANAAAWERAERLWASFDAEPDVLLQSMRTAALRARPDPQPLGRGLIAASAAAVVVLSGLVGWREITRHRASPAGLTPVVATETLPRYATPAGKRSTVRLADNSQVTLDSGSTIEVAFTGPRRDVRLLRGQAFFVVSHDAVRPFQVDAGGRTVTDLGTAFDVRFEPQSVYVVLAKGSVSISQTDGRGPPIRLSPGQSFEAAPGQTGVVRAVDVNQALAWRTGYLEFRDEPLAKAVAEMNRYGGVSILIPDQAIRSLRVSGRFQISDPIRFARVLTEIYPVRVIRLQNGSLALVKR